MFEDKVLLLDFGGTNAQSVARKLRGERIYCEVLPYSASMEEILAAKPRGILLAGGRGPEAETLRCETGVFSLGLPVLAMGYGARLMVEQLGGCTHGVLAEKRAAEISFADCALFDGLTESDRYLERIDAVELPEGFSTLAFASGGLMPAFGSEQKHLYALQFYPETNDPDGLRILFNFAVAICGCEPNWSVDRFVEYELGEIRRRVGDGRVLMAISGGVDSSVCAALMHRAVGNRLTCVYVNTGLMRKGETELVTRTFREQLGLEMISVDATDRFLIRLKGVTQPREKRRAVVDELMNVFADEARRLGPFDCLAQGTIYPDVIGSYTDTGAHGRNAEPFAMRNIAFAEIIEPLRVLFKDEVRMVGEVIGIPRELVQRQPFPGPGLAVRCIGEVTAEKLRMLRDADAIFREEIAEAGLDKRIWQYFAVLTGVRSIGLRESGPCYENVIALRAVSSQDAVAAYAYRLPYDLLERVVQRITTEVPGVNRVVYDMTSKPTAMIEWE